MATIPIPPSYSQILASMIDSTVSKLGLPALRKGNPVLSILEASSRSDARQAQDIFNLLRSVSLDQATGQALDRIGADEDASRIPETPASGPVTIGDSSFAKIASRIFQGKAAPNVGSTVIYVQDAASFTPTGSIYLGRGTQNLEGPLAYTGLTNNGAYWTVQLNLANPTTKYHNIGETAILAQGGNRLISPGTSVRTSQGNSSTSVKYTTLFSATLPDGEVEIANVQVVCSAAGVSGNSIAGGINSFASPPFAGATVTNPLPFSNGLATEDDETYRERLRLVRQSRSRGTPLAIKVNLTGITALDENKSILSTSVITRQGYPTTVYIDDGTGYEAKDLGVPYEVIVDQALGGEQYLQLVQGRPVAKAYSKTTLIAPFFLTEGETLSVKIGGVLYQHTFGASSFRNINNASAYEVVSAINANYALAFQARTADNGSTVAVFAKNDTNEDVEVIAAPTGFTDANVALGFPLGRNDTLRLYKDDRLLNKDGTLATIISNPQANWGAVASGDTLVVLVDGIQLPAITFVDQDFVNAGTVYSTVAASNDLASWAKVFNSKVPGITATAVGGTLVLTSNLGRNARAAIAIDGSSTMCTKNMFTAQSVHGKNLDYTFDRNLGQIRLEDSLIANVGDSITAGSIATRAFLETPSFNTVNFGPTPTTVPGQTGAELFFCLDSDAQVIPVGINSTTLAFTRQLVGGFTGGQFWRLKATTSTSGLFDNVQPGDFVVLTEATLPDNLRGVFRIIERTSTYVVWDRVDDFTILPAPLSYTFAPGSMTFVRSSVVPERVYFPYSSSTPYTATSLAASINTQLEGGTASVYRTTILRVRTNRWALGGNIVFVAANADGYLVGFEQNEFVENQTSHLAAVETGNDLGGTPEFVSTTVFNQTATATTILFDIANDNSIGPENIILHGRPQSPTVDGGADPGFRQGSKRALSVVEYLPDNTPRQMGYSLGGAIAPGDVVVGHVSGAMAVVNSIISGPPTGFLTLTLLSDDANFLQNEVVDRLTPSVTPSLFTISGPVPGAVQVREPPFNREWISGQKLLPTRPFDISPNDHLAVLVDNDTDSKRFISPMFRNVTAVNGTYSSGPIALRDGDNGNSSLAKVFGTTMEWNDFAVHMHARTKSHRIAGVDTNKTILWRYYRMGPDGERVYLQYQYPIVANAPVQAVVENNNTHNTELGIRLASGAARSGYTFRPSTKIGVVVSSTPTNGLYPKFYALNLKITAAERTVRLFFNAGTGGFSVGDLITGATSGATGIIRTIIGGPATGYFRLAQGNNISFVAENLNNTTTATPNVAHSSFGQFDPQTTITLGMPPGVSPFHGFQVGDQIWVQSSDVNFISGQRIIDAIDTPTPGTVTYTDVNINMANGGAIGTASQDPDGEAKWGGGNIALNDIFHTESPQYVAFAGGGSYNGGLQWDQPMRITTLDSSWLGGATPVYPGLPGFTALVWVPLNDVSAVAIYPLNTGANAITAIATAVNAQADTPVTAVAVGNGSGDTSGVITRATYEAAPDGLGAAFPTGYDSVSLGYKMVDGINWIRSHDVPVNDVTDFNFVFKKNVDVTLLSNSDWANEAIRFVPITSENINDYLNTSGPGGLFANTELLNALSGRRPQIATLTIGSGGSVEVQGGTANSVTAAVAGGSKAVSNKYAVNVPTKIGMNILASDAIGLNAKNWVKIQNALAVNKIRITGSTALTSITNPTLTTSKIILSGTKAWDWAGNSVSALVSKNGEWQVERHGKYVGYKLVTPGTGFNLFLEGDWVHISNLAASPFTPGTLDNRNTGFFRVVRADVNADVNHPEFWVENPNAVEEVKTGHVACLAYDSSIPGDKLNILSGIWGANNIGNWEVASIDLETLTGLANNQQTLYFNQVMTPNGAVAALGASFSLVQIAEPAPSHLFKRIFSIEPNSIDPTLAWVKVDTTNTDYIDHGIGKINENAGSFLQALDKLDFPTDLATGVDGYKYNTGLIGEANKVAYGQESDPQTYPGVVAAGARVNIEGPVVHRVQIGLAIRVRSGAAQTEIQNQVRSAVAAVINATNVGVSIAISDLIDAAGSVNGVISVAVVSPTFTAGTDLINIQPFEKPLVLSLDDDILVSFIGD